jgi:hypothetical protein
MSQSGADADVSPHQALTPYALPLDSAAPLI